MWESIVTEPRVDAEPTSWLQLARIARLVEPIWHHDCVRTAASDESEDS